MILLTVLVLFVAVPLVVGCLSLIDDPIPDMERILDCPTNIYPFTLPEIADETEHFEPGLEICPEWTN
jgi:hypothetical protein